jgi:phosphoserine phosphatase RsbU/P
MLPKRPYPSPVQIVDLSDNPRVGLLLEMLSDASRATRPIDVLRAFGQRYWSLKPIDYFLSISVRGLEPGQYKITRRIDAAAVLAGSASLPTVDPWGDWEKIPVREGGLVGALVADPRPKLVRSLPEEVDPVLGRAVAPLRSCIALPLYERGEVLNWAIEFRRAESGFTTEDLEEALVVANLIGSTNRMLLLYEEVRRLHSALRVQFEDVARVQRSLLPRKIPDIPGLQIATSYLTSDQAGGDYYDFFEFEDGTWGILIADVSGHGAGAATVMAMLHGILHAYTGGAAGRGRSPDGVLRYANHKLVEAGLEGNFVTAFFAIYDPRTAALRYSRSGHNPPRLKDGITGKTRALDGAGTLPLGIFEPYEISSEMIQLAPMDTLVLYTDGITEAFDSQREMFGIQRLDEALDQCTGIPDCVVDSVHAALYRHTSSRTRADDQTLVALRYIPKGM